MKNARRLRRGIYLLPTLFTIGNLFCGFFSLVQTFRGAFEPAAMLIVLAAILDGLDGRIARITGTTSEFGNQFDSLADIVSFGVSPAMLAFEWGLQPLGRIGWLVAFLFVVCAATRLARFNIQAGVADKRWFAGLPSPSAAVSIACLAFAFPDPPVAPWIVVPAAILVALLGLLMVSRLRYRSFKELDLRNRRSYLFVVPLAAMIVAVAVHPQGALLLFAALYALSAPAAYLWGLARRRKKSAVEGGADQDTEVVDGPALR